jgi:hypothetical protein
MADATGTNCWPRVMTLRAICAAMEKQSVIRTADEKSLGPEGILAKTDILQSCERKLNASSQQAYPEACARLLAPALRSTGSDPFSLAPNGPSGTIRSWGYPPASTRRPRGEMILETANFRTKPAGAMGKICNFCPRGLILSPRAREPGQLSCS